jgi:hypothetical protein
VEECEECPNRSELAGNGPGANSCGMQLVEKIRQHIMLDITNARSGNTGVQETTELV